MNEKCGCYYCLKFFELKEVKEFVDKGKTAICPKCRIDSVCKVSDNNEDIEFFEFLVKKHVSSFCWSWSCRKEIFWTETNLYSTVITERYKEKYFRFKY